MSPLGDTLHLLSHLPGRIRVRARRFHRQPDVRDGVVKRLLAVPGVESVEASALTGSILIHYDPREVQVDGLLAVVLDAGGLSSVEADAREHPLGTGAVTRVWEVCLEADRRLFRATRGKVDLRSAVPGALAAGAVLKLLSGGLRMPGWHTLFFWSYVTFTNLNLVPRQDRIREERANDER